VAALAKTPKLASVLLCMIQAPALAATKELRITHRQVAMPIFGMSFIATSKFATEIEPAYDGLSLVMPFLLPRASTARIAHSFREKMTESKQEKLIEGPTAFESYFYGRGWPRRSCAAAPAARRCRDSCCSSARSTWRRSPLHSMSAVSGIATSPSCGNRKREFGELLPKLLLLTICGRSNTSASCSERNSVSHSQRYRQDARTLLRERRSFPSLAREARV
jgi:hypothetical protein